MGMLYRRYHAARLEQINKNDALEEAKRQIANEPVAEDEPVETETEKPEKRKYTKRIV